MEVRCNMFMVFLSGFHSLSSAALAELISDETSGFFPGTGASS